MTITTTEQNAGVAAIDQHDEQILRYLGLNPNNPADRAAVAVCRAYDFDPILKHVIVIPKGGVYITRDGLLHVAHRSGQLDGIVVDQEPTLHEGEWTCRVSVYRKDMGHPFTYPGRYSARGSNRDYAPEMALKAAEAHALRRAFDVTGLPTIDEQQRHTGPPAREGAGLAAALSTPEPDPLPDPHAPGPDDEPLPIESPLLDTSSALAKAMFATLGDLGISEKAERLGYVSMVLDRQIGSSTEMTEADARAVIDRAKADLEQPFDAPVAP